MKLKFLRPEALEVENGRYKEILLDLRYYDQSYAEGGIDASEEIMSVVENKV